MKTISVETLLKRIKRHYDAWRSSMTEPQIVAMIATILELQGDRELTVAQITDCYRENLEFSAQLTESDLEPANETERLDRVVRHADKLERNKKADQK